MLQHLKNNHSTTIVYPISSTMPKTVKARGSRAEVWHGNAKKTSGGLTKDDLMKNNKTGRIVSKKMHARGKKLYREMKAKGVLAEPFKKKGN